MLGSRDPTRREAASGRRQVLRLIGVSLAGVFACSRLTSRGWASAQPAGKSERIPDWDLTRVPGQHVQARGTPIELTGRVLRSDGAPLAGLHVELSHADAQGRYPQAAANGGPPADPGFRGRGVAVTGLDGTYRFRTVKPGAHRQRDNERSPHVHIRVYDGPRRGLATDLYFGDEPGNSSDPVYRALNDAERHALTARRQPGDGIAVYRLDLVLA